MFFFFFSSSTIRAYSVLVLPQHKKISSKTVNLRLFLRENVEKFKECKYFYKAMFLVSSCGLADVSLMMNANIVS